MSGCQCECACCTDWDKDMRTHNVPAEALRALENVRMLVVSRRSQFGASEAEHLLRFCAEAGVVGSILRATDGT